VPVGDLLDTPLLTPDNAVQDDLAELGDGSDDLWEVPGERALLARLQGDAAVATASDAAVS
jgi:hypothetical protein